MVDSIQWTAQQLGQQVEHFLNNLDAADKTRQTYRDALNAFGRWLSRKKKPLSPTLVKAYRDWLRPRCTANTVATYLVALRRFLDFCVQEDLLPHNPAQGVRGVRKPRGHLRHDLSRQQLRQVFDQFDHASAIGLRDYALVNLMVRNGLRVVEVVRANVGDLELVQGRTILRVLGKGRDSRDEFVVLSALTRGIVEEYLEARGRVRGSDPLFVGLGPHNYGGRLSTRTVHRRVTHYLEAAGVKTDKISPHSLRHSFVTLAIEGGATLVEAQAVARHRSVQTTMVYFHEHGRLNDPVEDRIQI